MKDGGVNFVPTHDAPDEDDEEDYEDQGRESRLLGFMFGNVDHDGDLDADYLDEDAKEHLAALVDKLDPSLTGIDIAKSPTASDALEHDYGTKAENAINYEDIEEQYEGPEVQSIPGENSEFPDDYLAKNISISSATLKAPLFDEENYDEDDEVEKEIENVEIKLEVQTSLPADESSLTLITNKEESSLDRILASRSPEDEQLIFDGEEFLEDSASAMELKDSEDKASLPILYVDEGTVVLRFSEIFGIHEPIKRTRKRDKPRIKIRDVLSVEEDEELFLRSSLNIGLPGMVPSSLREAYQQIKEDEGRPMVNINSMDSCLPSQPMKEDSQISKPLEWNFPILHELYPLHQLEWEDQIIWGTLSPPPANEGLPIDQESNGIAPNVDTVELHRFGDLNETDRNDHLPMHSLKPQLDNYELTEAESLKSIDEILFTDTSRSFRKLTLQNKEFLEGNWLDQIIWDSSVNITKPKLIYDLQDEKMLFEVLDAKDAEHLRSHAGAMVINHLSKSSAGYSIDSSSQGGASLGRFNISNDKYYSNRKTGQQTKTHAKKRVIHGLKVMHSVPALKLQTMKPKLSNKDMANFHRPKAQWFPHENEFITKIEGAPVSQGSISIAVKSLGGKSIKFCVAIDEMLSSLKWKLAKKLDVKSSEKVKLFYTGRELEDDKSLASQNIRPNSLLHLVRSKIHLLPRAQKLPGENKPLRPPGAFKKKSDLSVKDGHVFLMEYCEERPLLLGNIGMGARLCTYYLKSTPGDQTAATLQSTNSDLGNVLTLDPADKSPFLGDIKPGCYQSSLETNMYRAPVFPHKLSSTDYLLVRSAKGTLSLRRIDKLYVVGQQEPHMEAMSPGTKNVLNYIWNRLLVHVYREFRVKEKPGFRPRIRADDLYSLFPSLTEAVIRKRLKHCADLKRGRNGVLLWEMKSDFHIPSEEELRRMLTPENVCSYESMQAGLYRLKQLGIRRLTQPIGLSSAMNQLPDEAIALAAASHIERELLITSWNLSSNFVACTSQDRENIERLEITGVGDPSGRGLGFSYVRITPKAPITSALVKKKTSAARGSSTVTGTDADLRRLSMDAAREVLLKFNVPEEQIEKLTRWHRIALVRRLSSEQAVSGVTVDTPALCKFARGQRMSFLQLQQQTREKCQEIWDRQSQSLTAAVSDGNESDSGAHSDLDSFAGDLENLLDAEEFEEGEEGYSDSKSDKADVVKGLKMRRCPSQAQKKEEMEDDEAEALVIHRLFEDDVELKKKKMKPPVARVVTQLGPESDDISKKNTLTKRVITTLPQPASSVASKEISIREPKEITKEKRTVDRPVREGFACGACGQMGHMRTNKNCPKYGGEIDLPEVEATASRAHPSEVAPQLLPKVPIKKLPKIDAPESSEKPSIKLPVKILPLKFKYGPETPQEKISPGPQSLETETTPTKKIKKLIISSKSKPQDQQQELQRPTVVIKMPAEMEREQPPPKKIIFKQTKSFSNLESFSLAPETGVDEGFRKIKKIAELAGPEPRGKQPVHREGDRKRRERGPEEWRMPEEQNIAEVYRHDDPEWGTKDREGRKESMQKKKKKKKKSETKEKYSEELWSGRSERPERDRAARRHAVVDYGRDSGEYAPPTKRRRGGEVSLCNILEKIVDTLRTQTEVSYLFLKPVSKKEAPDYLDIIKRPMDLSTIKEKVKKMEYRGREDFRHDVWQITYNAHRYNDGRNPGIPPLADQLLELCDYLLEQNDRGLSEAESGIEI